MSMADIESAMRRLYPPAAASGGRATIGPYEPSLWEKGVNAIKNTAVGHAFESALPGFGIHPSHTVNDPDYAATRQQLIAPQEMIQASQPSTPLGYAKDVARAGLGSVGSFTSGENMATMVGLAATGGAGLAVPYFAGESLIGAEQSGKQAIQNIKGGKYHEAATNVGESLTNFALARSMMKHGGPKERPAIETKDTPVSPGPEIVPPPQQKAATLAEDPGLKRRGMFARPPLTSESGVLRRSPRDLPPVTSKSGFILQEDGTYTDDKGNPIAKEIVLATERERTKEREKNVQPEVPKAPQVAEPQPSTQGATPAKPVEAPKPAEAARGPVQTPPGGEVRPSFEQRMEAHHASPHVGVDVTTPEGDGTVMSHDQGIYTVKLESGKVVKYPKARVQGLPEEDPGLGKRGFFKGPPNEDSERGSFSFRPLKGAVKAAASPLANVLQRLDNFLPSKTEEEQTTRNIIREKAAHLDLEQLRREAAFKEARSRHELDTTPEIKAFMDAGEGKQGARFLNPIDQSVADELHKQFQVRWDKVKGILGLDPNANIDNYLSHLWEKPGVAKNLWNRYMGAKKPLEGSAFFTKQRIYEYFSEGLDAGLKPISNNPIDIQMAALHQLDKFIAAHEIKEEFRGANLVKWFDYGDIKHKPDGWMKLDDKIFQPEQFVNGVSSRYGYYFAPPEVARVFNNYLAPGLHGNPTYEAIRSYANRLNMINLGISGYHGTFITMVSGISDVALGLEQVRDGKFTEGSKNILRGSVGTFLASSARRDWKLGKAIEGEALHPTGDPRLATYVKAIEKMGGAFGQDPEYANKFRDITGTPIEAARKIGKLVVDGHSLRAIDGAVGYLASPIMKYYVPRLKLAMAARMAEEKVSQLVKEGRDDAFTVTTELGKVWDSVDNRAGQMRYKNLFWDPKKKDLAFLAIRAVGWDYGSLREYGGALADTKRGLTSLTKGDKVELSHRMAFTIASTMVYGMMGAAMTWMATGRAPRSAEDYFFPPTGKVNADGSEERLSIPGYHKDIWAMGHHPLEAAVDKLHPMWRQAYEVMWTDQDFYGNAIYGKGDHWYNQGADILKYLGKGFVPFSISGYERHRDTGQSRLKSFLDTAAGIQPAPRYISQTPGQRLLFELAEAHREHGPRDPLVWEQYKTHSNLISRLRNGENIDKDAAAAYEKGKLTDSQYDDLFDVGQGLSPMQRQFKSLLPQEAGRAWDALSKSEKLEVQEQMEDQLDRVDPDRQPDLYESLNKRLSSM